MQRWLIASAVTGLALASATSAADPAPSWVFFHDKAIAGDRALDARAAELSPRALARRQRARNDRGLDARDLPVASSFVADVRATGARVRVTSRWLNAVSVVADARELAAIARLPHVRAVRPVASRHRAPSAAPPPRITPQGGKGERYGLAAEQLAMLEVPAMHACGLSGAGVVVAVLDSGFTLEHQALAHLDVLAQHDFIHDDDITSNEAADAANQHDHGTAVLSLLAGRDPGTFMGVAPDITVILAKTEEMSFEQPIEEDWFVAGLEWAESLGADLATASLGYVDWYADADLDGNTAVTTIASNVAMQNGLVMIAAAGNWGPDPISIGAPADADKLIAVGAVDLGANVTDFSSRGPTFDGRIKPDVSALGQDAVVVVPGTADQYAAGNGTSYAAPLVAGVAALLKQAYPALTPAEMHALLTNNATHSSSPDNAIGYGIVRGYEAAGLYCTCHDVDADGEFDVVCGGEDCDDSAASVHPDATEQCNGRDDDCDGSLLHDEADDDGDGALACGDDCNDADPAVNPDASEICGDMIDNDCSGADDECPPPPPPEQSPPRVEPSCGCRVPARNAPAPFWWLTALLAAIKLRRLRRAWVDESDAARDRRAP